MSKTLRGGQGEDWKLRIQGIEAQTLSISDVGLIDISDPYSSTSVDKARYNLNTYGFMPFSLDEGSAKLFSNLQDEARKYFDLSLEEKMRFAATEQTQGKFGNRGYFPYGTEVPSASGYPDPKEYLHIGSQTDLGSDKAKAFGHSDFSKLPPNTREVFLNSYDRFQEIANMAIGVALKTVDIDIVSPALVAPITNSVLRLIHYPALTDEEASRFSMRAAPHKGFHVVGVQIPPRKPGLQYITPDERVVEPDGSFVGKAIFVNIARMLADYSGHRLFESPHQVALGEYQSSRISTVYFHHPDHRMPETYIDAHGNEQPRGNQVWGDRMAGRLQKMKIDIDRNDKGESVQE